MRGPGALASLAKDPSEELPVPTIPSGASHALSTCQAAPLLPLVGPSQPTAVPVSLQMWALWKAWPITVAGTRCTGQATRHPPLPVTRWTRLAQGPSRGRRSSPCLETTTQGPLCWMSARSELLGRGVGAMSYGSRNRKGTGPTMSCCVASVKTHHLSGHCLIQMSEAKGRLRAVGDASGFVTGIHHRE